MRGLPVLRALCALLAAIVPVASHAACDANNTFTFDWNSQAAGQRAYGTTFNFSAGNPLGAARPFSVLATANGLAVNTVNNIALPAIGANNVATTGAGQFTYTLGGRFNGRSTTLATAAANTATATITFSAPVRDLSLRLHDIDFGANAYRDWVRIRGTNGANSYVPTFTRPATSLVRLGPSATAPAIGDGELLGTGTAADGDDIGTVVVTFAQPITVLEIRYGNYPLQTGETTTGQQWISVHDLTFCPMPAVTVAKTSTVFETTGINRFNVPGADVVYTLTVTNTGGSPVDLNGMALTDPLPTQASFFNGDFDGAGAGTTAFAFNAGTSGVSMPASALTFSNNGGASYTYAPAAGYDPAVNAIRFAPTGSMAANSTFSVSFRARIK